MQMPDMPINVEVDPNEDTEWNDILRSKGIIPEKPPSPTPMIEEALTEARRLAHENRLEGKELDELAELEDDEDEDFLESYRCVHLLFTLRLLLLAFTTILATLFGQE